jgi:DNA-directed RNA polymerase subunit alpha
MNKFSKSNIQINNSTKNVAKVTIKPLNKGFGVTLGNALRRTLLSSIPGASIFAIKTDGVKHEYDAVPGIKEDGVQFVLNVKKLVIKLDTNVLPVADLEKFNIEN